MMATASGPARLLPNLPEDKDVTDYWDSKEYLKGIQCNILMMFIRKMVSFSIGMEMRGNIARKVRMTKKMIRKNFLLHQKFQMSLRHSLR
ncbi:MAG: hypothetical protein A2509_07580 [Candidatus Edwardsbacteria bacterium RIFOXYD12_FULL_50_11]|uniref:Uncharacterized protein n=1 Tax=Candidatus Edwardsbacteria bacterium GWF2_54_11 TaxID=1817851 RepID=A0A1F5RDY5_9BACT|nr:MAG: hypothetical protein A2502_00455 [Candidatus Edwardsbacteria bacterium RifOxyC12_full_54_24]OGF06093.1 MAG: hypothetical protein A2273_09925 [Candidatus Edwardsbacteria bacterium RifOxyA12_full_54_48]OGF12675.1 MAG: hypothetical protein A2024_00390 [Candidatus Edwardsbacteria bacterium GWF2_54_11]OGF17134.1 MAG: hypothetical protein A2509_07580 [Candidatus Edwardsbacteria bacterium RIFOXYD12_FULL_50_11]OGJ18333.1 MAG: hypothetical protein A2349_11770 [Candidatus Edwardsbacteria bacteriu